MDGTLRPTHKGVQPFPGVVGVIVDAAELDEQGRHRPQVAQDRRAAGELLVDGRGEPRAELGRREEVGGQVRPGSGGDLSYQAAGDEEATAGRPGAPPGDRQALPQHAGRFLVDDDLPAVGQPLAQRHPFEGGPDQHVHHQEEGIAHEEAARRTGGDGHLDAQRDGSARRGAQGGEARHGFLHNQGGGDGPRRGRPLGLIEPAGDGVADEGDDAAAEMVERADQIGKDGIDGLQKGLGAARSAELVGKGLRQRRKARDIGKERRAIGAVGKGAALGQGCAAVDRDIGGRVGPAGGARRCRPERGCLLAGGVRWFHTVPQAKRLPAMLPRLRPGSKGQCIG